MKKLLLAAVLSVSLFLHLCSFVPAIADGWSISSSRFTPDPNNASPIGGATITLSDTPTDVVASAASRLTPPSQSVGYSLASIHWHGSYTRTYIWNGYGPSISGGANVDFSLDGYASGPDAALGHSSALSFINSTTASTGSNNAGTPSNKSYDVGAGSYTLNFAPGSFSATLNFSSIT